MTWHEKHDSKLKIIPTNVCWCSMQCALVKGYLLLKALRILFTVSYYMFCILSFHSIRSQWVVCWKMASVQRFHNAVGKAFGVERSSVVGMAAKRIDLSVWVLVVAQCTCTSTYDDLQPLAATCKWTFRITHKLSDNALSESLHICMHCNIRLLQMLQTEICKIVDGRLSHRISKL